MSDSRSAGNSPAIRATLLALAWPIFVEQGLRVLIGTVDTLMVSHLGDDAVAGLSVANQIVMLFVISFAFIGIGSSVVITHHLGARDREGADKISATAIATNFWIGLAVSLLVTLFSTPMLRGAPANVPQPILAPFHQQGSKFLLRLSNARGLQRHPPYRLSSGVVFYCDPGDELSVTLPESANCVLAVIKSLGVSVPA
jgi:hypothetical protein